MSQAPTDQDLSTKALELFLGTDQAKTIERQILRQNAYKAQRPLRWLALVHTFIALIFVLLLYPFLANGKPWALQFEAVFAILALAYWMLWTWSMTNPLAAAVTGLLLYTSAVFLASAQQSALPNTKVHPPAIGIFGIVCIYLLTRSIMAGSRQRRLEIADAESTPEAAATLRPGIASAIWLYVALLSILIVPREMAAKHELSFGDSLRIQALLTIVIVTWAIASWRVTLPAYVRWPAAKWFAQAIILGVATSLLAMIWSRILNQSLAVSTGDPTTLYFQHGLGWGAVIGLTCAWPAIFEEMAFRGIIVPVLFRALTKWEAIIASAAMFMILHLSVFSFPHLLCLGLALAYVRIRTGSIWPCVLMHFTHNFMCLWLT
jgi:membrane protease YdiL (CAAX protease family)